MDLADQIPGRSVAAHAIFIRIAPTHGAPNAPVGVAAHTIGDAGLWHLRKDFAVGYFSGRKIQIENPNMRRVVRPVRKAGVDDIEFLLVGRQGNAVGLHEVINDYFDLTGFRIYPINIMLVLLGLSLETLIKTADAVDGIGKPDGPIGRDHCVVW